MMEKMPITTSVLASTAAALGLCVLLRLEQERSPRPSDLAVTYLTAVSISDALTFTMPSASAAWVYSSPISLVRLIAHVLLLVIECCSPRVLSTSSSKGAETPEQLTSILGKGFFSWTNAYLFKTFDTILALRSLPSLDREIEPKTTRPMVLRAWKSRIMFKYSQPQLIKESILFVGNSAGSPSGGDGYWLVISAGAIYPGIAVGSLLFDSVAEIKPTDPSVQVSSAVYQHQLNKLKLMLRSMLIGLIHDKALDLPSITFDNGEANALMSNDVDHLKTMIDIFHETWAYLVEVIVGIYLLATQIGWIWPLPLTVLFVFSRLGVYVTRNLVTDQRNWNQATQVRIAATSSMISSMKVVQSLGLQSTMSNRIANLRKNELDMAAKVRWVMVYYNACANSVGIFSSALTLVTFALLAQANGVRFDTATAFTAIATLNMIMHPANEIMTAWPRLGAALASFDRIQAFLLKSSLVDHRLGAVSLSDEQEKGSSLLGPELEKSAAAIVVRCLISGPLQRPVNLQLAPATFTMILGPVGCGKSTLLRCLLGEAPLTQGSVSLSTYRVAYCAQSPWLPGGTIRQIITGSGETGDERFYHQVLEACCLTHDLDVLPNGDETHIGSRGPDLAGGLVQRISLARAVFSRCEIALLDDTFSALDGATEKTIIGNLLAPTGLLRRLHTTVVLTANSTQYFPFTDHVVVLDVDGVAEQGPWQSLGTEFTAIRKYEIQKHSNLEAPVVAVEKKKEADVELERYRRSSDVALYIYYFRLAGYINLALLIGWAAAYAFFVSVPQLWLKMWTESEGKDTGYYIIGFLLLCILALVSTHGTIWATVIRLAPRSGIQVHQHLLKIVMGAPLSFFSTAENGSILNRFGQDIQYVDQELPMNIASVSNQIFKLVAQISLLYSAEKLLALSLPVSFLASYFVQRTFMRSSRQLQLLELESRSAIFSDFLNSIEGLAAIRAFRWRRRVVEENVQNLNASQKAEFLRLSLQRWLNLVLDLIGAAMAVIVVATVTTYRDRISPGQAGVALNVMLVANATLLELVDGWTTMELNLGAIARARSLEQRLGSQKESVKDGTSEPPLSWPSRGVIRFKGVTAVYQNGRVALNNVSLDIEAGKKVMVHGRTGSGKSSFIITLLRMLDLHAGSIELDGIDINSVNPEILRQRCFVTLAQDALFLANETLRFNLDPEVSLKDEYIIEKLTRLGLWSLLVKDNDDLSNSDNNSDSNNDVERTDFSSKYRILNKRIADMPEFSAGQRQLLALCRAVIRVNSLRLNNTRPVILLDEPTSSLDIATESAVLNIIDQEFTSKDHTVILVTHRLGGFVEHMRGDLVVSMSDGCLSYLGGEALSE
ncbi:hypothetical protein FHL15_011259 [Xylaria flabelliformis]|uniref:ABC transporter domain-containing protein n=1 Tax=Xylaria flabelliformis TaxID=2512241 RepID=A0A553HIS2_9PEZI|nr:hypothetical protein FHL15_011259 [Xylaria flabelliformis]